MYTYILYDRKYKLYKIGRSSSPYKRFDSVCIKGRTRPICLLTGDMEADLHARFKTNRLDHPENFLSGYTEYFKLGGAFTHFITDLPKVAIPSCSIGSLIPALLVKTISSVFTWQMDNDIFAHYKIGLALLKWKKLITLNDKKRVLSINKHVHTESNKVWITEELFDNFVDNIQIDLSEVPDKNNIVVVIDSNEFNIVVNNIK